MGTTKNDLEPDQIDTQEIDNDESFRLTDFFAFENFRKLISDIVTHSNTSPRMERLFQIHIKKITIRRIQSLLFMIIFLIAGIWPTDYILFTDQNVIEAFFYWRICMILILMYVLPVLSYSTYFRKRVNLFFVVVCAVALSVSGIILGKVRGLDFPWFDFFAFMTPMFTVVLSLNIYRRLLATACITASCVTSYTLTYAYTHTFAYPYFDQVVPLTISAILLNSAVGHAIYHFDHRNFFNERKLEKRRQQIERLARYDQLTGLYNRRELEKQFKREYTEAERYDTDLSLLMIDLDHFKQINDSYGHTAGDSVLEKTGEIIQERSRSIDLSGRYGGEEFCLVLPQTSLEGAETIAERLREELSEQTFTSPEGEEFNVTGSIGLAERTDEMDSAQDLILKADNALYEAKESGRDTIVKAS